LAVEVATAVPVYFASDMHLRLDRPDRGRRLARWVETIGPDDPLYLVGDVCDFWFASRQRREDPMDCEGLRALAEYRQRGGSLTILPGNHDLWLGPFYERVLGASFVQEPIFVDAFGLRFYLLHGHRCGGRQAWKAGMESQAFLSIFEQLPLPIARRLDRLLEGSNDRTRAQDESRLVRVFRQALDRDSPDADVAILGHVHTPLDDPGCRPRLIILGGWHQRTSYLRVDERGANLVVEPATSPATV
jgi:UDP-2,3-diacylglucosamine hydrolase